MNDQEPERPSEILARQVRYWRERRKLSAQALANRLAELGASALNRRVVSKIENGDRGVTVDEWLQLAHALAVPPPMLFLDLRQGSDVKIADEVVIHPHLAWQWVVGEIPPVVSSPWRPPSGRRVVTRVEEFSQANHAIELYRFETKAVAAVRDTERLIRRAEYTDDQDALRAARSRHAEALHELARCLDDMVQNDIEPPALPGEWVEKMRSLKALKYPDRVRIFAEPDTDDDA
jgi:transcriptional regulator with XRE-family HTH domain